MLFQVYVQVLIGTDKRSFTSLVTYEIADAVIVGAIGLIFKPK